MTRVVSGSYTAATADVLSNIGVTASLFTVTSSFIEGSTFQLTGSVVGKFTVTATPGTDSAPNYFVTLGGSAAATMTNIVS